MEAKKMTLKTNRANVRASPSLINVLSARRSEILGWGINCCGLLIYCLFFLRYKMKYRFNKKVCITICNKYRKLQIVISLQNALFLSKRYSILYPKRKQTINQQTATFYSPTQ